MKKIGTSAALAAALLVGSASAALAQDQNHHDQGGQGQAHHDQGHGGGDHHWNGGGQPHPAPQAQANPGGQPGGHGGWTGGGDHGSRGPAPGGAPQGPPPQADRHDQGRGPWNGGGDRNAWRGPPPQGQAPPQAWQGRHDDGRDWQGRRDDHDRYAGGDRRDGDHRGWWGGDHHGGPQWRPGYYPPSFRAEHHFRIGPWLAPPGWEYRAWSYGEILPVAWWAPRYRLLDWWDYDLPEPPPGFLWIRSGSDALLIDPYGRIVQVVNYIFW
jgi:hypothetical protein